MRKKEFEDKSIIVVVPYHFGLPERFQQNLEYLGFKVFLLPDVPHKLSIPLQDKIIHGYKKTILRDRSHKPIVKARMAEKYYASFLETLPECDYALVIRPDLISLNTIQSLKKRSKKIVAYQWDGMERFAMDKRIIECFDTFYVFDERDLEKYPQCHFLTNFYFDDLLEAPQSIENDVFFVGTYIKKRMKDFLSLCNFFKKKGYITNFHLFSSDKDLDFQRYGIQVSQKGFSFTENILQVKKTKILLDFKSDVHYGLSFRSFESIGYRKKLITSNELIKKYDFYNSNNIFVFSENKDIVGLEEFLEMPYEDLPKEVYEKYSFTNWIKHIFDI